MNLFERVKGADLTAESDLQLIEDVLGAPENYFEAANAHLKKSKKYLRNVLNRALKYFGIPVPRGTKAAGKIILLRQHLNARKGFDEETQQRLAADLNYLEFAVVEYKRVVSEYRIFDNPEFVWLSPLVDLGDLLVHSAMELDETMSICCEGYEGEMK